MKPIRNSKTYYAFTIDFTAPTNKRLVTYLLSDSDVRNHYEKKIVPQYFDRFWRLFRRYGTYKIFIENISKHQLVVYNEPNVGMAVICISEEAAQHLLNNNLKT